MSDTPLEVRTEEGNNQETQNSNQFSPRGVAVETDVDVASQDVEQDHQVHVMEGVGVVGSMESAMEEQSAPPRLFSVHQSNVLFFLFFIGAVFCIGGDVFMQIQR